MPDPFSLLDRQATLSYDIHEGHTSWLIAVPISAFLFAKHGQHGSK